MEHRKYIVTRLGHGLYENKYIDSCRNCQGSGMIVLSGHSCSAVIDCIICGGSGEVQITKKIEVIIKPFKTHEHGK